MGKQFDFLRVKLSHLSCQRGEREQRSIEHRPPCDVSAGSLNAEKSQSPSLQAVGAISGTLFIFTVSHKNFNSFHRPFIFPGDAERCLRIPQLPGQLPCQEE